MDFQRAMQTALGAARAGKRGANPLVGAVVLNREGELASVGHHAGAGTAHAEVVALRAAGAHRCQGGTLVVTLEPCHHEGRTPPCTEAILAAGIRSVVYALDDPDHPGGRSVLEEAGLTVHRGVGLQAAWELNRRWAQAVAAGRPYTSIHIAQSIDGRIAAIDGSSQWISSPPSRQAKHETRARVDAILVGTGTALVDNPRLNARTPDGGLCSRQPLRVVLGQRSLPPTVALKADEHWVHYRHRDPARALRALHGRGVRHVLIEGGGTILAALIRDDLIDELTISLAPRLLGAGTSAIADYGVGTLAHARHFEWDPIMPAVPCGKDITLGLIPAPEPAPELS